MSNNIHSEINKKIYNEAILSGKIHESLEDPVSAVLYDVAESISPTLYSMGVTPNMITSTRFLVILFSFIYLFKNGYYRTTAILYMLSYFGDCLDGHMARKYNMDTPLGDYFDHIADLLAFIIAIYYISVKIHPEYDWLVILIFVLLIISLVQIGCEERYLGLMGVGKDSYTMSGVLRLCPKSVIPDSEIEGLMEFSRLFGIGMYILFITIIIWNFKYFENDV